MYYSICFPFFFFPTTLRGKMQNKEMWGERGQELIRLLLWRLMFQPWLGIGFHYRVSVKHSGYCSCSLYICCLLKILNPDGCLSAGPVFGFLPDIILPAMHENTSKWVPTGGWWNLYCLDVPLIHTESSYLICPDFWCVFFFFFLMADKVLHVEHVELLTEEYKQLKKEVAGKDLVKGTLHFTGQ